jgi:hypothetical protein
MGLPISICFIEIAFVDFGNLGKERKVVVRG